MFTTIRLNDYIHQFIQSNGFAFVVVHYIDLRNEYYSQKVIG